MGASSGQTIDARALFRNISGEVAHWAQVAERLDELIGQMPVAAGDDVNQRATQLQDMDALRQALHAIAQITSSAASEVPLDADFRLNKDTLSMSVTMESVRNACLRTEDLTTPKAAATQDMFFF